MSAGCGVLSDTFIHGKGIEAPRMEQNLAILPRQIESPEAQWVYEHLNESDKGSHDPELALFRGLKKGCNLAR